VTILSVLFISEHHISQHIKLYLHYLKTTVLNANTIKTSQHASGNEVMAWQPAVERHDKQIYCQPV
jgi:hypothetical protein